MTRRALLLGAAYGTLLHVPRSLDRLEAALKKHDFRHIELFLDLSSERLLGVLERFTTLVEVGDPTAIVYVGHGGRRDGIGYIRPSPDPHTVVGLELGAQLAALARKTGNVTLVLDCCHAAGVLADASYLDEAVLRRVVAAQRARTRGFETVGGDAPLDNVVQLLAAAASQTAVEDLERASGLFSSVLADVLELCAGLEVGWHEVIDEVRLRMRLVDRDQAPTLGGRHRRRVPFTERDSSLHFDDFACAPSGHGVHLAAGALGSIALGDRFALRTLGSPPGDRAATASVSELGPEHAVLALDDGSALQDTAAPLRAVKIGTTSAARPPSRWQRLSDSIALATKLPGYAFDIRWGRVDPDGRAFTRFPEVDVRIGPDDDLWVAFGTRRNEHAFRLFFAVFHLRPDDRLVNLNPGHPQGVLLPSDHHFLLASRFVHGLAREDALEWPKDQPRGEHSLVFLVSNKTIATHAIADSGLETTRGSLTPPNASYALACLPFTVA